MCPRGGRSHYRASDPIFSPGHWLGPLSLPTRSLPRNLRPATASSPSSRVISRSIKNPGRSFSIEKDHRIASFHWKVQQYNTSSEQISAPFSRKKHVQDSYQITAPIPVTRCLCSWKIDKIPILYQEIFDILWGTQKSREHAFQSGNYQIMC